MSFMGKENEPKPAPTPLRTYKFKRWGGAEVTIKAHYVEHTAGHVNFWKTRPDNQQDTLVFSEVNAQVTSLKEVTA